MTGAVNHRAVTGNSARNYIHRLQVPNSETILIQILLRISVRIHVWALAANSWSDAGAANNRLRTEEDVAVAREGEDSIARNFTACDPGRIAELEGVDVVVAPNLRQFIGRWI